MTRRDILPVIDTLYEAALHPEKWAGALAALSDVMGAIGATIVPIGTWTSVRSIASRSLEEANLEYQQGWWQHDTATARVMARGIRPGTVGTDRTVMTEEEIRRDPFYNEFLRRHGIQQPLAAIARVQEDHLVAISVQSGLKRELFQKDDLDAMTALSPHLGRAVAITTSLVEARELTADLAAALQRVDLGLILLDRHGNVRHVNLMAEQLLGDGLVVTNRRVHASSRRDDARLQGAIRNVLPGHALPPSGGVVLRRPSGKAPLHIELAPVRPRSDVMEAISFGGGGAMLLVRNLEPKLKDVQHHLRALGLSPAEARLAEAVGQGVTLRDFAEIQGVSYETARTHMRSIFAKLGIGRQAELVALVTRLASSVGGQK